MTGVVCAEQRLYSFSWKLLYRVSLALRQPKGGTRRGGRAKTRTEGREPHGHTAKSPEDNPAGSQAGLESRLSSGYDLWRWDH